MIEEWRDIKGYEGLYQVSNTGKVRSLNYLRMGVIRELRQRVGKDGYCMVVLSKNNKQEYKLVHKLVAEAFIPNLDNLPEINHKDECKTNNVVENLEYCSKSYNINYGSRNKRVADKLKKIVLQFSLGGEFIREWECANDINKELGIPKSNIVQACNNNYKQAGGFMWKYK